MIMNTRDKEITNQPRLKSFWPEIKFNLQKIYGFFSVVEIPIKTHSSLYNKILYLNTYLDVSIESLTLPWLLLFLDGHCCPTQKLLLGLFWTKSEEKPIFTCTISLININQFFQRIFPFQMTFWHELFYRLFYRYL